MTEACLADLVADQSDWNIVLQQLHSDASSGCGRKKGCTVPVRKRRESMSMAKNGATCPKAVSPSCSDSHLNRVDQTNTWK
jgi:hypothetical protein